jgi:hypothetical protein
MPAAFATKTSEHRAGRRPPKAEPTGPIHAGPEVGRPAGMPAFLQRKSSDAEPLPKSILANVAIGAPDGPLERQADRVAEAALKKDRVQRNAAAPAELTSVGTAALPGVEAGVSLADSVRERVEPVLGADLGNVRVHSGAEAARAAQAINARAFAHKNHIWLGPNESPDDTKLLAHEATHVLHQSDGVGPGDAAGRPPEIQRTPDDPSSPTIATPEASSTAGVGKPLTPEATDGQPGDMTDASTPRASDDDGGAESTDGGTGSGGEKGRGHGKTGAHAATSGAPGKADGPQAATGGREAGVGARGGQAESAEEELASPAAPPSTPETSGAGDLATGDLVLIDVELAEHQRWAGALGRVGEVGSLQRAEFVAEAVGSGLISGAASGLAMGLGMGLVTRVVPAIGPVIGGGMALHGLITRDWAATAATIGRFGEGSDTYETLANSIASVAAIIDIVSQVLNVINGIVGVVQIAAGVIAGGAVVAAFFTFGATLGIAAVAGDVVATCEEISLAIGEVTTVLDSVNAAILQPCVVLFRALHEFTTQADPREVETQGHEISSAAAASGAALGAWAGGKAAHAGSGARPPPEEQPPKQLPPHETPPAAAGDGPVVHFQEPAAPAQPEGGAPPTAPTEPIAAPAAPAAAESLASAAPIEPISTTLAAPQVVEPVSAAPPADVTGTPAAAPPAGAPPEQLTLPGTDIPTTGGPRRRLSPDEVAPPDARSAYLRRLRAEAEGRPPPGPGRRPYNIARHEVPDRSSIEGIWQSTSPTPDLYQYSPRQPPGYESHHVEQQSAFIAPGGGEVLPGYNPREDLTVMMPRDPEHQATFAAQSQQRAEPDFHQTVGTPAKLEEAYNIAVSGTRGAPTPGGPAPQLMDPRVAGQTVMEHSAYLFETSRISDTNAPTPGVSPRPGETPLASRPIVGDLVGSRGGIEPFENIDWDRTFNQPDPYRAAQPPGTQLALPGMEHLAPPSSGRVPKQLSLPGMDQPAPNPNQLSLPFDAADAGSSASPSSQGGPPPVAPPPAAPAPETPPLSSAAPPAVSPTATSPTVQTPAPSDMPAAPSSTVPIWPAAGRAAQTAPLTPGGPQPGTDSPTWGTRAHQVGELFLPQVFGSGGEAPTYAQQQAAQRARFTADNQPPEGVERVNPNYPPPPATPAQIAAIQNEIVNLLAARAHAEQEAQHQSRRADRCEDNQGPIAQSVQDTAAGISAVQAHDQAVAQREAANQDQQRRQQESQGLVAGYPSQATGLAALTVPLAAWEGFTSLASHLPGEAGDKMVQMNTEAQQMEAAFAQMGAKMLGVDGAGPGREAELRGDQGRLEATSERARQSDQRLQTASEGAAALQEANDAALAEAAAAKDAQTEQAKQHGDAAAQRQQLAASLAEQLRAWAGTHAEARKQAIAAAEQRLESEGRKVLRRSE